MNPLLIAFIKVNLSVALFYLFYKLLFDKDTFLTVKRIYLLTALIFSLLLPFINLTSIFHAEISENIQNGTIVLPDFYVNPETDAQLIPWMKILITAYLLVSGFFLSKILTGIFSLLKFKNNSVPDKFHQFRYFRVNQEIAPFSFFNQIFINPELHSSRELVEILVHEDAHAKQWHSFDILLAELIAALLWINPIAWLIKKDIQTNLEFIADKKVLNAGFDSKNYQYHLLKLSYECTEFTFTNSFNISPIKKRITMMNKSQTRQPAILKYVLVAPLSISLIMLSNLETIAANTQNYLKQVIPETTVAGTNANNANPVNLIEPEQSNVNVNESLPKEEMASPDNSGNVSAVSPQDNTKTDVVKQDDIVFMVVEKMPEYPGGQNALVEFLQKNISYPLEAVKRNLEGKVFCQFVIEKSGEVTEVTVVRSVDPVLDAEAVRVIKLMPKWTPGFQRGKEVRVRYTLPVNFKFGDGKKNESSVIGSKDPAKQPVFLVDGVKLPDGQGLESIKPESVEKMVVIKPENAADIQKFIAKYGARAANGIVEITLKK